VAAISASDADTGDADFPGDTDTGDADTGAGDAGDADASDAEGGRGTMIRRRLGRGLRLGAAAAALAAPLAGCVTVHGERENIPSLSPAEAARVLTHFAQVDTEAARTYDESYVAQIEAGPLGEIDTAQVKAAHTQHPEGNAAADPLTLSDTKYLIPRQVGWPKFFVADTATNRSTTSRWVLLFRRGSAAEPWRADYLAVVPDGAMPALATDQGGHVLPVPADQSGLLVRPDALSSAYAGYLQSGSRAADFAPGPSTTQLRADRAAKARTPDSVTQYADQADTAGDFAPAALRTKDGGALVFFATRHQSRSTYRAGFNLSVDASTRALMTGTPKTAVTLARVGQQLATVPLAPGGKDAGSGGGSGGPSARVDFLSRRTGLVSAKGE
jgi:hypothetical protein